jgi:polycomb protein EED
MLMRSDILSQNLQSFYTLSWASDLDGTPLLVAAGSNGIIRVINCGKEKLFKVQ